MAQALPPVWSLEWLLQLDGLSPEQLPTSIRDDPRTHLGVNNASGAAVARTLALSRSAGSLIRNLDADDVLLPGALARDISILQEHDNVGWVCSQALDLNEDGSVAAWPYDLPSEGVVALGWAYRYWLTNEYRLPMVPGTICIRRQLLEALGGWMALPASEDTGMLLSAGVISPGYFVKHPSMLYRKHPQQSTAQGANATRQLVEDRYRLIRRRVDAIVALQRFRDGLARQERDKI